MSVADREKRDVPESIGVLVVAYRGSRFSGFARQPGLLTVQGDLERALSLIFGRAVETVCAGRTDAGVHARGQVASFPLLDSDIAGRTRRSLLRSLNALTDEDVSVRSFDVEDAGFSARFSARMREYRYFVCPEAPPPVLMRDFCWHLPGDFDLEAMRSAATYLIGEHDFKSFCLASSAEGKPTKREIMELRIEEVEIMGEGMVCFTIVGNAFLHSMVRTIIGTLAAVGRGRRPPSWMKDVLAACDRAAAGEKAPAQGLVFWKVTY